MPVLVKIQFPEGKSADTLKDIMASVTDLLSEKLQEPKTNIRVTLNCVPHNRYSIGGVLLSESKGKKK